MLDNPPSNTKSLYESDLIRLEQSISMVMPTSPEISELKNIVQDLITTLRTQERERICRILNEV